LLRSVGAQQCCANAERYPYCGAREGAGQQNHCVRQRSESTGGGGSQPGNDPNKRKNSFYDYFKKLFKFIFNIFNNLKASIINKCDILIGLILLPFLVSLAYMTLSLHNYLDVNMANYLMFKETLA
jgi:hypothetical protein